MAFLFTSFENYIVIDMCNQLQGNGLLYLSCEGDDSIIQGICKTIQTNLSLLSYNRESYATDDPHDHNINFHLCYHFPTSIYDDSCFTLINLYALSHYSDTCQVAEALQHSPMVMLDPHYLDKPSEHDKTHFPSQDSHLDPKILIQHSSFQRFQGSQEDCFEFHDPITNWLDQSYLERSVANNKFRYFFKLGKEYNADENTSVRRF